MSDVIFNLCQAKTSLSRLVDRAAAGEEIVIAKAGMPRAKLVPISSSESSRKPGGWEGQVYIADDFDDPLPEEFQAAFEGRA